MQEHPPLRRSGLKKLIDVLESHGVEFIFTMTGTDIYPILVEADKRGIRVIDMRNEAPAAYAAKGVGRMTGKPGVVIVSAGPGATNTFSAAMDAKFDEVPIIIMSGGVATRDRGKGVLHDLPMPRFMKQACKKVYSVERKEHLIRIVKKAFQISCSGVPGPVYIQLPVDVLLPYKNVTTWDVKVEGQRDETEDELPPYVSKHKVDNSLTPLPIRYPVAGADEVLYSAGILELAKRPLIVIGTQVAQSPENIDFVPPALKSMGIPCFLDFTAKGLLGRSHKLLVQYDLQRVLAKADVVVLAGFPCDYAFRYGLDLPKSGKIITVGRNEATLTLNAPRFWKPAQIVHGDVAHYLIDLSKVLRKLPSLHGTWIQTCQEISNTKEKAFKNKAKERTKVHLNPLKLIFALNKVATDNAIFVADIGDFGLTARWIIRPPSPLTYIYTGSYANVGNGMGVAIGVKICRPECQIWLISGDGASGYYLTEFDTCVRHKIPILEMIGTDAAWNEIARKGIEDFGKSVGGILAYSNYQEVAVTFGAKGILLDLSNEDAMEDELLKAQKLNDKGKSVCVNAFMGTTNIRDGYA